MTQQDVLDYIRKTPHNSNVNVVKSMLDSLGGSGGDVGYECTETKITLTEESVTTVAHDLLNFGELSYSQIIDAETIFVTFNGTEYECAKVDDGEGGYGYGGIGQQGPDFSEYPFAIILLGGSEALFTETAGTYAIKIEAVGETVITTPCFRAAVKSVVDEEDAPRALFVTLSNGEASHTPTEIYDAYSQGISVVFKRGGEDAFSNPSYISFVNSMVSGKERATFFTQRFDYLDSNSIRLNTSSCTINRDKTYTAVDNVYRITGLTIEDLS